MQYGRKKLSQYENGGMREVITGQKKSLKLGMIGTGRHCRANLLPNLPFLPVELISVCAAHKENAEYYGKKYGATFFYDNVAKMLDEQELDLIVASVNADTHPQLIASAVGQNIPIFVEKPVASSIDQIEELIKLDTKKRVMVGFQKRFAPNYRLIKEAIDKKNYGNLHSLHLEFGVGSLTEGTDFFLLEVGIHFIDLLRYFTSGLQIESVLIKEIKKGQINCNIAFRAEESIVGNLYLSTNFDWSNCHERVLASFEKENIMVDNLVDFSSRSNSKSFLSIPLEKISKKRMVKENWHPNYITGDVVNSSHYQAGFLPELQHFCRWVSGEEKNSISNLENALETHKVMESILKMAK
jgi:myo-inositol 2-dehydrogenase/D-chiro-inositol 1-dehydrogenase